MTPANNRTVHGVADDGGEIVRYDRAGKWYVEYYGGSETPDDLRVRHPLSLDAAVFLARLPGARVFFGRPGGSRFDARVRASALDEEASR